MKLTRLSATVVLLLSGIVARSQYEVGELNGAFAVNEMGAATYSLPFDIPEGINGMQPSLGLVYNSQSGNGVAGMGMSISGLSVIYRTPRDIFHDGTAKGLSYSTSDAYAKDGVRMLLKSGTDGKDGAVYNVEGMPYNEIILKGSGPSQYFIANLPDGSKAYYGRVIKFPLAFTPIVWYLEKIVDVYGNAVTYNYSINSNCMYLSNIVYGTNDTTSTNFSAKVIFSYENRPDTIRSIQRGYKCNMSRRLKTVTMKTMRGTDTTTLYSYVLTYKNTDAFSRLATVTKSYGTTKLPPVTFTWNALGGLSLASSTLNNMPSVEMSDDDENYQFFVSADMTGNGKSDLVLFTQKKDYVNINVYEPINTSSNTLSFKKLPKNYNITKPDLYMTLRGSTHTRVINKKTGSFAGDYIGDFDGDGANEIIIPYFDNAKNFGCIIAGKPKDPMERSNEGSIQLTCQNPPLHTMGDFYNCGKSQILFIDRNAKTIGMLYCDNNGNNRSFQTNIDLPYALFNIFPMDCNNNGLLDLLLVFKDGYIILWNHGVGEGQCPFSDSNTSSYYTTLTYSRILQQGDFNGDGLIDFLSNSDNDPDISKNDISGWYFYLNNGDGTFTKTLACTLNDCFSQSYTDRDNNRVNCLVWDFDNDGKQDVVITKADYKLKKERILWILNVWGEFLNTHTYWLKSTGTSLVTVKETTSSNANDALSGHYILGDFDGDGFEEMANYGYNCYTGTATQNWYVYNNTNLTANSNKISKISSSNYGTETVVSYASLTDSTVYTQGTGSAFPILDMTIPIHVVKQTTQKAGGYSFTKDYAYAGLRAHLKGRGLLGFKTMSVYDEVHDERVTTTITNLNSEFFIPTEVVTTTSVAGNESSSKTTLTVAKRGTKNYFSYPSRVEQIDIYGNKTTVQNTFDTEYGYQTNQYISYGTGNNMYKRTAYSSFVKVGGVYKPQIVVETQKHKDASSTFSVKTLYEYNTKGAVVKTTEYANTTPNYHAYTYDVFGNITIHSLWASGIDAVTTNYTYDATHRFVAKETTNTNQISINHTYNALDLLVGTSKILNGNMIGSIQYTYDAVGRKSTVKTSPEVTNTTYTYGWGSSAKKRYYVRTESTASPSVTTWYDNIGRTVLTETFGEDSVQIRQEKTYGMDGNMSSSKLTEGNISSQTTYVYDLLGRLRMSRSNTGNEKYFSYGNKTVTEYDNGRQTIKTYDEWGNVKTITDNEGSTIQYTYNSNGNAAKIEADGAVFQMTYNAKGQQTSLTDPDAGKTTYTYDALGRIIKQVDYKGITTTNTYNNVGLLTKTVCGDITTTYTYDTQQRLTKESTGSQSISYQYNTKNQLTRKTITIDSTTNLVFRYNYNSLNQLYLMYYPDNTSERYYYDANGNMNRVTFNGQDVWKLTSYNGTARKIQLRDSLSREEYHTADGYLNHTRIRYKSSNVNTMIYTFDKKKGLLLSRSGMLANGTNENFTYDSHDRLTETYTANNDLYHSVDYATNGNIVNKTGIGAYSYESDRPHAVTSVDNIEGAVSEIPQYVTYTPFNKVATVTQGEYSLAITYGPDRQRNKTALSRNDTLLYTRYYADNYEEVHAGDTIYRYYYVYTPDGLSMIAERIGNTMNLKLYSVETDYLGSIVAMYNYKGQTEFRAEYDAWGMQNVVTDNLAHFQRGYCGHEHWHEFDLIDMNGRMYDPVIARFLSPDPFVQVPEDLQNYNRYSYCLNNPLKYSDPSGELAWVVPVIAGTIIGSYMGGAITSNEWNPISKQYWQNGWKGSIVGGILGATVGSFFSAAMAPTAFGSATGFHTTGMIAGGKATVGWGITTSALESASINIGISFYNKQGLDGAWKAGVVGAISGVWTATGGLGLVTHGLGGKLGYQMIGTAGRSIGRNWSSGAKSWNDLTNGIVLGVGPVNLNYTSEHGLGIDWHDNIGNIIVNGAGIVNIATGGRVSLDKNNLTLRYYGGFMDKIMAKCGTQATGVYAIYGGGYRPRPALLSHEAHHIWQSRSMGSYDFMPNYFSQFALVKLMGRDGWKESWYETQAYKYYWFK